MWPSDLRTSAVIPAVHVATASSPFFIDASTSSSARLPRECAAAVCDSVARRTGHDAAQRSTARCKQRGARRLWKRAHNDPTRGPLGIRCCIALQRVVLCCNVLYCVATSCAVLQHLVPLRPIAQHVLQCRRLADDWHAHISLIADENGGDWSRCTGGGGGGGEARVPVQMWQR